MGAYYNEIDAYAAQWLRNLIAKGLIPEGDVDERSICDVAPEDLRGYAQCHFFAGIGGWAYAARLAGWPDERPLWTGSAPCQPFSVAGKGKAQKDERHLWPVFFELIRACRPPVLMGEQVAAAVGKDWLDGVCADLEGVGYACGATVVPACAVDAPHRRDRLWFVANADASERRSINRLRGRVEGEHAVPQGSQASGGFVASCEGDVADAAVGSDVGGKPRASVGAMAQVDGASNACDVANAARERGYGRQDTAGADGRPCVEAGRASLADADEQGPQGRGVLRERGDERSAWSDSVEWAIGADGKARRVEPSIRLLAHGVPARVGRLRAYGNAIVPQVAAEVIGAFLDTET